MNSIKKELKGLDAKALAKKVGEYRRELFKLRLTAVSSPTKDYKQFGKLRKSIATALTFMSQTQKNK